MNRISGCSSPTNTLNQGPRQRRQQHSQVERPHQMHRNIHAHIRLIRTSRPQLARSPWSDASEVPCTRRPRGTAERSQTAWRRGKGTLARRGALEFTAAERGGANHRVVPYLIVLPLIPAHETYIVLHLLGARTPERDSFTVYRSSALLAAAGLVKVKFFFSSRHAAHDTVPLLGGHTGTPLSYIGSEGRLLVM